MDKIFDIIQKFAPVLIQFPKWVQIFFFAVILQLFALIFILLFSYVSLQKNPKKEEPDKLDQANTDSTTTVGISQVESSNTEVEIPTFDSLSTSNSSTVTEDTSEITLSEFPITGEQTEESVGQMVDQSKLDEMAESNNPDVALSLANLATLLEAQGKYREAENIWLRVQKIQENAFGRDHPVYAQTLQSIANLHIQTGRFRDAEPLLSESLETIRKAYGEDHPLTASALNNLGALYLKLAEYDKASALIEAALNIRMRSMGEAHPDVIPILENLLIIYERSGDAEKARTLAERITQLRKQFGQEEPN